MGKKIFTVIIVCINLVMCFSCNGKYTKQELIGTYVNNYNEVTPSYVLPPEAPRMIDTLILLKNGSFISKAFGKGNYKVYEMNGFLYVHLTYEEGKAGYSMTVRPKGLFGEVPVLKINSDGDYYYKKIK
jgi:hypothetical protein